MPEVSYGNLSYLRHEAVAVETILDHIKRQCNQRGLYDLATLADKALLDMSKIQREILSDAEGNGNGHKNHRQRARAVAGVSKSLD